MTPCYSALAPIYDRVMAHVDYGQWMSLIRCAVAKYLKTPSPRVLEIGGGTGVLATMLKGEGYRYHGSDLSPAMCREASRKGHAFFCGDALALPVKICCDLVLFLYDGINYLTSVLQYTRVCRQVHSCLRPGGLFVFDITTEANSRMHFLDFVDFEESGDSFYVRHSYFDLGSKVQHNDFTIFRPVAGTPHYSKHRDCHAQLVLPTSDIRDAVPEDLFEIVGVWDGYTTRRHTSRSDRIHFCLRKRG